MAGSLTMSPGSIEGGCWIPKRVMIASSIPAKSPIAAIVLKGASMKRQLLIVVLAL